MPSPFNCTGLYNIFLPVCLCLTSAVASAMEPTIEKPTGYRHWLTFDSYKLDVRSDQHSDPLPLRYFGQSDWVKHLQPRAGLNLVRLDQSIEIGLLSEESYGLAIIARNKGRLIATEETLNRAGELARDQSGVQDWRLTPKLSLTGFSGLGLAWQKSHALAEHLRLRWGAQGLLLKQLYSRDLAGLLDYQSSSQSYIFDITSFEKNSRLKTPFQSPFDSSGQGLLFQADLQWTFDTVRLEMGVSDVGWLRWQLLPEQLLNLNSNTSSRDANGYLLYKPLVQGQNYQRTVLWTAPWTGKIQASWYATPSQVVSLPWTYIPGFGWLPAYRWTHLGWPIVWSLEWRQHDRNLLFESRWNQWTFGWGLNNSRSESRSQAWHITYVKKF